MLEDINNNGNKCGAGMECINQSSDSNESVSPTYDEISSEIIAGCLEEPKDTELEETYDEVVKSHRETSKTKEKSHVHRVKTDNIYFAKVITEKL